MRTTVVDEFGQVIRGLEGDAELASALASGERVVWSGAPRSKGNTGSSPLAALFFSMIYSAPFLLSLAIGEAFKCVEDFDPPLLASWRSLESSSRSLLVVMFPLIIHRLIIEAERDRRRRAFYVLTDRRALVFEPRLFRGRRLSAYTVELPEMIRCKAESDGSGTLSLVGRSESTRRLEPLWFSVVRGVRDVESKLRTLAQAGDAASSAPNPRRSVLSKFPLPSARLLAGFLAVQLGSAGLVSLAGLIFTSMLLMTVLSDFANIHRTPAATLLAALLLGGVLVSGWLAYLFGSAFKTLCSTSFEVSADDDRTVTFQYLLRTETKPVADVLAIESAPPLIFILPRFRVRLKNGAVEVGSYSNRFLQVLPLLKQLNPAIDLGGIRLD